MLRTAHTPEVKVEQLAEIVVSAAERKGRDFFAKRDAIEKIRQIFREAGDGDLIVRIARR